MSTRDAVCREATGLTADARVVELRPGFADRAVAVVRWLLTAVGTAVLLWAGSALLATSAAAAVVVPMAASNSVNKGGSGNSAGAGDKKAGDKKAGDKKAGDKKAGDKKAGDKKAGDKKAGDKKAGDKKAGDKKAGDKKAGDKKAGDKKAGDKKAGDKKAGDKKAGDKKAGDKKAGDKKAGDKKAGDKKAGDKKAGDKKASDKKASDKTNGGGSPESGRGAMSGRGDTSTRSVGNQRSIGDVSEKESWGEGVAAARVIQGKVNAVRAAVRDGGDVRRAVRELVKTATDLIPGDRRTRVDSDTLLATADSVTALLSRGGGDRAGAASDLATLNHRENSDPRCSGGAAACPRSGDPHTVQLLTSSRGPPHDSGGDGDATEKLLDDRIAADKGAKDLAAAKKKFAAGTMSAAGYAAAKKKHKALVKTLATSRQNVDQDQAHLVDEVVDGHSELSTTQAGLNAEAKRVAAGKVSAATHAKHVAAYDERRDEVYAQTDELRAATDRAAPTPGSEPGDGAAAGCGSSGAFVECRAETANDRGRSGDQRDAPGDRCVALAGVSSGCGVSARSGDAKASASCTLTGSKQGCRSSSTKGAGADAVRANAWCGLGTGDCGQSTRATSDGATMACESGNGCRGDTTGPGTRTDRDTATAASRRPAGTAPGERSVFSAACTGACGVDGRADWDGAEGSCATAVGTCDARTTGSGPAAGAASPSTADPAGTSSTQATAAGHCIAASVGCGLDARVQAGADASGDAHAWCGEGATGCRSSATGSSKSTHSSTPAPAARAASTQTATPSRGTDAAADCAVTAGACTARFGSAAGSGDDGDLGRSTAAVEVEGAGTAEAVTKATAEGVVITRTGSGSAKCTVRGGDCDASSSTQADNRTRAEQARFGIGPATGTVGSVPGASTDDDGSAVSIAEASVNCDVAACSGTSATATTGRIAEAATSTAAARQTTADAHCSVTEGGCSNSSTSQVADAAPASPTLAFSAPGAGERTLTADSTAASGVTCAAAGCRGSAGSGTTGAASGDVTGVRDSKATSACTSDGAGGACTTGTNTNVEDRAATTTTATGGAPAVSGPVSVSDATADVTCAGAETACGGSTSAGTSARDTAVAPKARGTSTTSTCTVTGGDCAGRSTSAASSAPDHVTIDPTTGRPLAGQPLSGPSSTARSEATLDCENTCSGSVTTTTTAFDETTRAPRTSTGTASCTGGTGGCQVQSISTAATGPGAALALAGDGQATNAARLPAGPSAASVSGALVVCQGALTCTGKATSAATATDPRVSPNPRGSSSGSICAGVTNGVCQGVTNSGASTGPDANRIAPIMQAAPTENATTTSETTGGAPADQPSEQGPEQPATPPAPGSSANSGGPTVPGSSSWSMADATFDCADDGMCAGTARTSATGSGDPAGQVSINGARGPPAGDSATSGTCTATQSGCHVQTRSTAGSGQVVANIVAQQRRETATQLADQAKQATALAEQARQTAARAGATAAERTKATTTAATAKKATDAARKAAALARKPVTDAPATSSTSTATGQCTGPACAARTTGAAGGSRTDARCVAGARGCAVGSDATATRTRDHRTTDAHTSSTGQCPDAGCTATLTASSDITAGTRGRQSHSTATGGAACAGAGPCSAEIETGTAVTLPAGGTPAATQFATTDVYVSAVCGTAAGCTRHASSVTKVTGGARIGSTATAACGPTGMCRAGTGGTAARGVAETQAACVGTSCTTRAGGVAKARSLGGQNTSTASTRCTAGVDGRCAGSVRVGASAAGAQTGASCTGSPSCRYAYRAVSHARAPGAAADAVGHREGMTGSGQAATSAAAAGHAGVAQAAASCVATKGSSCRFSFRAASHDRGRGVRADSVGQGSGRFGGGQASSAAVVGKGAAQAGAACSATKGASCRFSFRAKGTVKRGGATARADARGAGRFGGGRATTGAVVDKGAAQAGAACSATKGASCRFSFRAKGTVKRGGATARAVAHGAGRTGGGRATTAVAAGKGAAQAAAACTGTRGTSCTYAFRAKSRAKDGGAVARATAHGKGRFGVGRATAAAVIGKGAAQAGAACTGTKGSSCRYSYRAKSRASAAGARAYATGSDRGRFGGGQVAVTASASSGPGFAQASASCTGTKGSSCRYSYRAEVHARAAGAQADAVGSGSGRFGGGQVAVTASASSGPGFAQASASCMGSAGTSCRHSYSATASASARDGATWAQAYAHGSGGGGMGGGGVSVSASAYARGSQANASASCSGAANCTSSYSAHAEANDATSTAPTWTQPGKAWNAHGEGTCSGSGNGGCGVQAYAQAGPGGGGGATCTGNCANFTQSGYNTFVVTAPSLRDQAVARQRAARLDKHGKPVDIEKLGIEDSGAKAGYIDRNGKFIPEGGIIPKDARGGVQRKESGKPAEPIKICPSIGCSVGNRKSGPGAVYDPGAKDPGRTFRVWNNVAKGDARHDEAGSESYAAISRDANGNGKTWTRGRGYVVNGRTGERIDYTRINPFTTNTARLSDHRGSRFYAKVRTGLAKNVGKFTYTSGKIKLPKNALPTAKGFDELHVVGTDGTIVGRGPKGSAGIFEFTGSGTFTSAEGDSIGGLTDSLLGTPRGGAVGHVRIVTRDADGYGGSLQINGVGTASTVEGAMLECENCFGIEHLPVEPGKGGFAQCSIAVSGSGCTSTTPRRGTADPDVQRSWLYGRGRVDFVQYHRNADGSGGGAVAFVTGNGGASGIDAYGNHVSTNGDGGRMALLYAEKDGYNSGQACVKGAHGACNSSEKPERMLRWIEPTREVTAALGLFDTTAPRGDNRAPIGSYLLGDRARAAFDFTAGQSHLRWMAEVGNKQLEGPAKYADKIGDKPTDKQLTRLAVMIEKLGPKILERGMRTDGALRSVLTVRGTQQWSISDVEQQLADDPQLVAAVLGRTVTPGWQPSAQDRRDAKNRILDGQDESLTAIADLAKFAPKERELAEWGAEIRKEAARIDGAKLQAEDKKLGRWVTAFEKRVKAFNSGRGGDYAELETERQALTKALTEHNGQVKANNALVKKQEKFAQAVAALAEDQQPYRERLASAQAKLRGYDLAVARAGQEPAYAENIAVALRNIAAVRGVAEALPVAKTRAAARRANTIVGFVNAVTLGYEAAIEAPRAPGNLMGDAQLPSTGSLDVPLALRAADGKPFFTRMTQAFGSPFVDKDGNDISADDIANKAATWSFSPKPGMPAPTDLRAIARLDGSPDETAYQTQQALLGPVGGPDWDKNVAEFFTQTHVDGLIKELGRDLPQGERDKLTAMVDANDPLTPSSWARSRQEIWSMMAPDAVRYFNRKYGAGLDDDVRNYARGVATVFGGLVGGLRLVGDGVVEWQNRADVDTYRSGVGSAHQLRLKIVLPRAGESYEDTYTREYPLTGGMLVTPAAHMFERLADREKSRRDYQERPVESFLEDITLPLLVLAPVSGALRAGASSTAARASLLRAGAARLPAGAKAAEAALNSATRLDVLARRTAVAGSVVHGAERVLTLPFTAPGIPIRAAALGVRGLTVPLARGVEALGARAGSRRAGSALTSASSGLARTAESARAIARHGVLGRAGLDAAYRDLGVSRAVNDAGLRAAFESLTARAERGSSSAITGARIDGLTRSMARVEQHRSSLVARLAARDGVALGNRTGPVAPEMPATPVAAVDDVLAPTASKNRPVAPEATISRTAPGADPPGFAGMSEFRSSGSGAGRNWVQHRLGKSRAAGGPRAILLDGRSATLSLANAERGLRQFLRAHPEHFDQVVVQTREGTLIWKADRRPGVPLPGGMRATIRTDADGHLVDLQVVDQRGAQPARGFPAAAATATTSKTTFDVARVPGRGDSWFAMQAPAAPRQLTVRAWPDAWGTEPARPQPSLTAPERAPPLADTALRALSRRPAEIRQAAAAATFAAIHILSPQQVYAHAPDLVAVPAVREMAAPQGNPHASPVKGPLPAAPPGGNGPVRPQMAVTPGLARDLASGRLGGIRLVPMSRRTLNRLGAPPGVSGRVWAAAGPFRRAALWNTAATRLKAQKAAGRPVFEWAGYAAERRAELVLSAAVDRIVRGPVGVVAAVRAVDELRSIDELRTVIDTLPRMSADVLMSRLAGDPLVANALLGTDRTTAALLQRMQTAGVSEVVLRDILRAVDGLSDAIPELVRDGARPGPRGQLAVELFAERHDLGWDDRMRADTASTLQRVRWEPAAATSVAAVAAGVLVGGGIAVLTDLLTGPAAAVTAVGAISAVVTAGVAHWVDSRGPPRGTLTPGIDGEVRADSAVPGTVLADPAVPVTGRADTAVPATGRADTAAPATMRNPRVGLRWAAELTAAAALTELALVAGPLLAAAAPAFVLGAGLAAVATAGPELLRRLDGGRTHALATRTLQVAVPLALGTGALLAGAPAAGVAAGMVAGLGIGRALMRSRGVPNDESRASPAAGGAGGGTTPPGGAAPASSPEGEPPGWWTWLGGLLTDTGVAAAAALGAHHVGVLAERVSPGAAVVAAVVLAAAGVLVLGVAAVRSRGPPAVRRFLGAFGGGLLAGVGLTVLGADPGWSLAAGGAVVLAGAVIPLQWRSGPDGLLSSAMTTARIAQTVFEHVRTWVRNQRTIRRASERSALVPPSAREALRLLKKVLGGSEGGDAVEALMAAIQVAGVGSAAAHEARAALGPVVTWLLRDGAAFGISDRRIARALRVPTPVATALMVPARAAIPRALARTRGVDRALASRWAAIVQARNQGAFAWGHEVEFLGDVEDTAQKGARWARQPQGGREPASIDEIQRAIPLDGSILRAYAADTDIPADVPPAVGGAPGKHRSVEGDLELTSAALTRSRTALANAGPVADAADQAWFAAVEALRDAADALGAAAPTAPAVPAAPADLAVPLQRYAPGSARLRPRAVDPDGSPVGAGLGAHRPRGPPWQRRLALPGSTGLRAALQPHERLWTTWQQAEQRAAALLVRYRGLREEIIRAAGGLPALVGTTLDQDAAAALDALGGQFAQAKEDAAAARSAFVEAITPVVQSVPDATPVVAIMHATGLDWIEASAMTGRPQPDPGMVGRFWDRAHLAWIRTRAVLAPDSPEAVVDERINKLIGTDRLGVFDVSDGHFHYLGYDDPRSSNVRTFLASLAADGRQGVVTIHPIPQRMVGLSAAGGMAYYATAPALVLGLVFGAPVLQMWGVFGDVRLLSSLRTLPRNLAWRAVLGVTGARLDVPGALGYLQTMAALNPDLAVLIGETTIAKEAVRDLLGEQAIHVLNPTWDRQVRKLETAYGTLREKGVAGLPTATPETLVPTLLAAADTIKAGLRRIGRHDEAAELLSTADLRTLPLYNPNIEEQLRASHEIGWLVVLHNDFGLARILADGRFGEETPDEQFGMPLLALLKKYPGARVILAHLGVGKWTTLPEEHLKLIETILKSPDYAHVSFDISWNEVARHLQATPEITAMFVDLAVTYKTRFVFGSDAVKPESLMQYDRHVHDLEPIFAALSERDRDAYHRIRHDNLETLLAESREQVQRWAYVQLASGAWDEIRAQLAPDRQAAITYWIQHYELSVGTPSAAAHAEIEIVDTVDLFRPSRPGVQQVRDLLTWTDAVTPEVVAGRFLTWKLIKASITTRWAERSVRKAHKAQREADRHGLAPATDTAGTGLVDAAGVPYLMEAVIAADQSVRATTLLGAQPRKEDYAQARKVLADVQRTGLAQRDDRMRIEQLKATYKRRTFIIGGVTLAVLAAGTAAVLFGLATSPTLVEVAPVAASAAFAVRGGLNLHRIIYLSWLRQTIELALERGHPDTAIIQRLATIMGRYAALERMPAWRLDRFQLLARQALIDTKALLDTPLAEQESVRSRMEVSLKEFSIFLDKAGSVFGVQAQSLHGLGPQAGLLGRLISTVLASTFVVNLGAHLLAIGAGAPVAVNVTYVVAEVLFLFQALPVMVGGLAGYDLNLARKIRAIGQSWAMPVITVANALLTVQLLVDHSPLALVGVALTASTVFLSRLGIAAETMLGRLAPRLGVTANAVLSGGLVVFGLTGLLPQHLLPVIAGGALLVAGLWTVWRFDVRRADRARGPPVRSATPDDLERIVAEIHVHTNTHDRVHGAVVVAPGDPLRAYGLELRTAPGNLTVVVHADREGFWYLVDDTKVRLTGAQLAKVLHAAGAPAADVDELVLCACSAAAKAEGPARELARATGLPVVAADSTITVHPPLPLGSWVGSTARWYRVDSDSASTRVVVPSALTAPIRLKRAPRLGRPGVHEEIEPRALPTQADAQ